MAAKREDNALGPRHPKTLFAMNQLAELLRDQGLLVDEAEALFTEVVTAQKVGLGAHPAFISVDLAQTMRVNPK